MAYVATSRALRNAIDSRLQDMQKKELSGVHDYSKWVQAIALDPLTTQYAYDAMWGPLWDLRDRLSPYSRKSDVRVMITFFDEKTNEGSMPPAYKMEVRVPLSVPIHYQPGSYYPVVEIKAGALGETESAREFVANMRTRNEILDRWAVVRQQVLNFVDKAKSLNEAVRLWPDLRRYIDDEYLERLDRKEERVKPADSEAAKALAQLDPDLITTSTVLARMAQQ